MKKTLLIAVFFCFFALIIPGTSLFADIGMGGRIDGGIDLLIFPGSASSTGDEQLSEIPMFPLINLGFYGQFNFGILSFGAGLRGASIIVVNMFWPSVYAELNLWRCAVNARIGGGALYLFPIVLYAGPYFIPELSLWYTIFSFKNTNKLQFGFGALTILSPKNINQNISEDLDLREFYNNVVFNVSIKISFNSSWKTW
jgi:hypothetical protein